MCQAAAAADVPSLLLDLPRLLPSLPQFAEIVAAGLPSLALHLSAWALSNCHFGWSVQCSGAPRAGGAAGGQHPTNGTPRVLRLLC